MQNFWQQLLSANFIISMLTSSVVLAMPLLIAGLGETFAERSGILNIGVEGIMLFGALSGFLGARLSGSPWVGLHCGFWPGC